MSRFSFFRWGKSKSDTDSINRKNIPEQNGSTDPNLPEKKRARRRLVGSVTLVLAAIIILPMIFESKPKQVSPDLIIDIPSKEKNAQIVASSSPVTPTTTDIPSSTEQPTGQSPGEGIAPAPQPADIAKTATPPVEKDRAVAQEKSTASDKGVEQQKKLAEKQLKTEKIRQEKTKTNESSDPIGKMIAEKNNASAKSEKQIIQVAALTSQQKVSELQSRLSKAGIRSYTQKVKAKDGGERIRVRVGPFSSKNEVDSTCSRLKAMGLSCTLVSN